MIQALFFDFDGTLWDSESAVFDAYRRLYAAHGFDLPADLWATGVGTLGGFDPVADLEARLGREVVMAPPDANGFDKLVGPLDHVELRPGIRLYIDEAMAMGLTLGIVSSNDRAWVEAPLERLGVADVWDVVITADGDTDRAKPNPEMYREALIAVGAAPDEAVALEDSPHGIAAAHAAGIFCVAIPNDVTVALDLSRADLVVESLESLPLRELLEIAVGGAGSGS